MNNGSSHPSSHRPFIAEFEGLRGLLAAWVVFGHILLFSGFTYEDGLFGIIFSPVLGVYVFMMLSGFVIFASLDRRPTTWLSFMRRRFWRLFPVYLFCLVLAIILFNPSVRVSQSDTLSTFGPENLERLEDVQEHFGIYLLADLTLLQCLLPRVWYPMADESFLPPTWSLTIEWLFYLLAPAIMWWIRRGKWSVLVGIASLAFMVYAAESWLTNVVNRSFHLWTLCHFLTGIGSYYLWKHFPERRRCWATRALFWAAVVGGIAWLWLPYKIWLATMAVILYSRVHRRPLSFLEWPRRILTSRPLQFLGRTSYVTYLLHWIVIELVLFWISHLVPGLNDRFILATMTTLIVYPLTYLFAHALHQNLELPLMRLGSRSVYGRVNAAAEARATLPAVPGSGILEPID